MSVQEIAISFFVSIAAGFVVWWIKWFIRRHEVTQEWRATASFPEKPAPLLIASETEDAVSTWRSFNRAQLNARLMRALFFIFTFYFLCAALALPTVFHQGLSYSKVDLARVEVVGAFTNAVVSQTSMIMLAVACACILYVPLSSASDWIAALIFKCLYRYVVPSADLVFRLRMGVFAIVCVLLSGFSVFLFTDLSFTSSMVAPVMVIVLGLASARESEQ